MFLFPENNAFGLDFSDHALRLAQVRKYGKKFGLISQNETPLPRGIIEHGDILDAKALVLAIKKLISSVKGKKVRCSHAVAVLPEPKTFIKHLKVFAENANALPETLAKEMTKHIPFSINEIFFDWQIIGKFKPNKENDILLGVAPMNTVTSYISALKEAGIIPLVLEIEAAAIARAVLPITSQNPSQQENGIIVIDLGATRTSLIVYNKGIIHSTISLGVSGEEITNRISEKLKLDEKKAEDAKVLCGLDEKKCSGALKKILMKNVMEIISKIEEAMYYFQETAPDSNAIGALLLTGGGSQLIGLDRLLSEKFQIPVIMANPLVNISRIEKNALISRKKIQSFNTAIGLALRGAIQ